MNEKLDEKQVERSWLGQAGTAANETVCAGSVHCDGGQAGSGNDATSFMRRAIELAKNGEGWTNPNPLVGAVIVKDGVIIGEGYHHKYGGLHAEREALLDCKNRGCDARGATIYVTLEPCAHFGKQPPCSHALVEAGIKRVFVGSRDPNPLVAGKGNAYLREHGIEVTEDFLREECDTLNPIFFHYITTKTPYVALKYAMTADGKIATSAGKSKWITGEKARAFVHQLRNRYASILCGIGTVLADDPMLNCRLGNCSENGGESVRGNETEAGLEGGSGNSSDNGKAGNNPIRIVLDSSLRIPLESRLVKTAREIPLIVACCEDSDSSKKQALESAGAEVLVLPSDASGHPDIPALLAVLGERKIDSVLVEGGAGVNFSFLESGVVNCIYAFIAPKLFGGEASKSPVGGSGVQEVPQAFNFEIADIKRFDKDVMLEMKKCLQE